MDDLSLNIEFLINSPEVAAATAKVKNDISSVGITADKVAEQTKQRMKVMFSDSKAEVEAYKKSLGDVGGRVASSGLNEYLRLLNEDLKAGKINAAEFAAELKRIDSLKKSSSVSAVDAGFQNQIRSIESLKTKLSDYKEEADKATSVDKLNIYNAKIESIEAEIKRLTNAGKVGFDDMGKKLATSLEKPVGVLNRLKYAADLYKKAASEATNPVLIEKYNRKLQDTDIQIKRTASVGKQGFDGLGNAIKGSTNFAGKAFSAIRSLAYLLPGIGIAGIIGFAVDPIIKYITQLDVFKTKLNQSKREAIALGEGFNSTDYTEAVSNIAQLTENIDLAKKGFIKKDEVVKQYNETIGKTTGFVTDLDGAERAILKSGDAYIKMTLLKASAQLELQKATKLAAEAAELESKKPDEVVSFFGKVKAGLEVVAKNAKSKFTGNREFDVYDNSLKEQADTIVKAKKDEADKTLEIYKKLQGDAAKLGKESGLDIFDKKLEDTSKQAAAAENQYQAALAKRQGIISEIAKVKAEYDRKSKSSDEQAIQAIRDRFVELKASLIAYNVWADNYNKTHKKKVEKVDINELAPTEKAAIEDLKYRQDTEKLKIELEKQKQLYTDYEQFKLDFGKEKADEKFAKDLLGFQKYSDVLKQKLEDTKAEESINPTGPVIEQIKFLSDELEKQLHKEEETRLKILKSVYDKTIELKKKEDDSNKKYDEDLAVLRENYAGEELANREAMLAQLHALEISGIREQAFEQTKLAQDMAKNLFSMTRAQLKEQLATLKEDLKKADLTPAQRLEGKKKVKETQSLLNDSSELNQNLAKTAAIANAASDSFHAWGDALSGVNDDLAYTLNQIGDLTGIIGNLATDLASGDPIKMVTGVINAAAGLFTIGKRVREMNAAARAEVQAFYDKAAAGEIQHQALLRERARQQARDHATNLKAIKEEQKLLLSQGSDIAGQQSSLFSQLQGQKFVESTSYKHGTWFRKAKTTQNLGSLAGMDFEAIAQLDAQGKLTEGAKRLFDQLVKLKEEGGDVEQALKDAASAADELATGTNVDSLSDKIIQDLRQGKVGLEDIMKDYNSIIQEALLSSFESEVVEEEMNGFFKRLSEAAKSGEVITSQEKAILEADYIATRQRIQRQAEQFKNLTGTDFLDPKDAEDKTPSKNSLSGAISAASQESIDLLAGNMLGLRLAALEGVSVAKQTYQIAGDSLKELKRIEENTRETVRVLGLAVTEIKNQTEVLETIEGNTGEASDFLSANGHG